MNWQLYAIIAFNNHIKIAQNYAGSDLATARPIIANVEAVGKPKTIVTIPNCPVYERKNATLRDFEVSLRLKKSLEIILRTIYFLGRIIHRLFYSLVSWSMIYK
jgi:hypothetical protein